MGARYYPFGESKFVRKFDKKKHFDEQSILEILSYHFLNEVEFINQLKKELSEQGLMKYEKRSGPTKGQKNLSVKIKFTKIMLHIQYFLH